MVLFNLGFRPFFLAASVYSVISMLMWLGFYSLGLPFGFAAMTPMQWHAHEMIYGYGLAVIAGFLLTAVRNWTGVPTLQGRALAALWLCWLVARAGWLSDQVPLMVTAAFDTIFVLWLAIAVAIPVHRTGQWGRQVAILSKLFLIGAGNVLCYLGLIGGLESGMHWGLYGGFYLIVGLILTMGRRVIPFFIEKGVDYPVELRNSRWLDLSSLVVFLAFFIVEVFLPYPSVGSGLALVLFVIHCVRLAGWHTAGIWYRPLLWSLYLAYGAITAGFALRALAGVLDIPALLAVHAFAVGGIGLVTLSMMSRVSLGHTGRSVQVSPKAITAALAFMLIAAVLRVGFPLFDPVPYPAWVLVSQIAWILAFSLFLWVFVPTLLAPRVDGREG